MGMHRIRVELREMQRMWGMRWECGESGCECGSQGGNAGNQGWNAGNRGVNVGNRIEIEKMK